MTKNRRTVRSNWLTTAPIATIHEPICPPFPSPPEKSLLKVELLPPLPLLIVVAVNLMTFCPRLNGSGATIGFEPDDDMISSLFLDFLIFHFRFFSHFILWKVSFWDCPSRVKRGKNH